MPPVILDGLIFGLGVLALVWLSWRSLRQPRSHGFYRFFAFAGILALVLLNRHFWFVQPLSLRQLLSWALLIASAGLAIHGFDLLGRIGQPDSQATIGPEFQFERTTQLVETGAYRYIRHPLYASLLYLAWGAGLKHISGLTVAITVGVTLFLFLTARVEEGENRQRFGPAYADYVGRTKMFIPYVW